MKIEVMSLKSFLDETDAEDIFKTNSRAIEIMESENKFPILTIQGTTSTFDKPTYEYKAELKPQTSASLPRWTSYWYPFGILIDHRRASYTVDPTNLWIRLLLKMPFKARLLIQTYVMSYGRYFQLLNGYYLTSVDIISSPSMFFSVDVDEDEELELIRSGPRGATGNASMVSNFIIYIIDLP